MNVELGTGGVEVAGVPVISPVVAFRVRPEGNDPDEMLQVKGEVPPLTARSWS
jgi:hypothetical protein